MTTSNNPDSAGSPAIDFGALLKLANTRFDLKAVDWGMRGSPITAADVLMCGAYAPAARRILNDVAAEPAGVLDKNRLREITANAVTKAIDLDFAGNVITNYDILLREPHGFGHELMALASLVPEQLSTVGGST